MRFTRFVRYALLVVVFGLPVQAQPRFPSGPLDDYVVTTWQETDGLPSSRVRAIEQDADGYLWLGTDAGLVRFDGVRFMTWAMLGGAPLPDDPVLTLLRSRDRSLWIGFGAAGAVARVRDDHVTIYGPSKGLDSGSVVALLEDHEGTIWVGGLRGLHFLRDGKWQKVGMAQGIPDGPVLAIHQDRARRLWLATSRDVYRTSGGTIFTHVDTVLQCPGWLTKFSEDRNGVMWLTDLRHGLTRVDDSVRGDALPGFSGCGAYLLSDRRGNLWVATQGQGLWRARMREPGQAPTVEKISVRDGLTNDAIRALLEDAEGNLWVGTHAGLQRFSPRRVDSITDLGFVRAVEASRNGTIWVGTSTGLIKFSGNRREELGERNGLPGPTVFALHSDREGVLWVSTTNGLARYEDGRFVPVELTGSPSNEFLSITSTEGAVWLRNAYRELYVWEHGALAPLHWLPDGFKGTSLCIYGDTRGNVWIGTTRGQVGVIHPNRHFEFYQADVGNITTFHVDDAGVVWVGGVTGLSRLTNGRFVTVNRRNGFPGDVSSLSMDAEGFLWAGIGVGIARLDPREFDAVAAAPDHQLRYSFFDAFDGVSGGGIKVGGPNVARASDGNLWFARSRGVTVVKPKDVGVARALPPAQIDSISSDATTFEPVNGLEIPPQTAYLRFTFTALTLTNPTRVRFRYRLAGFDAGWVDAGTSREVTYTNLPPGPYRFQVIAGNDGGWNEPGDAIEFSIQPAFAQTLWFRGLFAAVVGLVAWCLWQLRVRRVRNEFALVLAERIRMGRAIHDTLLQGLVGLALQFDDLFHTFDASPAGTKARLLQMRTQVEEYIDEARNSIWDLRSPRIGSDDFGAALRAVGERVVAGAPVEFACTVVGTPVPCADKVREELVFIAQEATTNAVRHGNATRIDIELRYDQHQIRLRVSDNGCGFDVDVARRPQGHYGLVNMRERAENVFGDITIASHPGLGTTVETVVWAGRHS